MLIRKRFLARTFNDWSVQLQLLWSIPRKNEFCSYKEKGFEIDEITCYATLKETKMEELPCSVLGCFENLVRFPKCNAKGYCFRTHLIWELAQLLVLRCIIKITNSHYSSDYSAILQRSPESVRTYILRMSRAKLREYNFF